MTTKKQREIVKKLKPGDLVVFTKDAFLRLTYYEISHKIYTIQEIQDYNNDCESLFILKINEQMVSFDPLWFFPANYHRKELLKKIIGYE